MKTDTSVLYSSSAQSGAVAKGELIGSDNIFLGALSLAMNLFGRSAAGSGVSKNDVSVSHRLTLDLSRSDALATMLANSRACRVVETADLLAGMYIYGWERLSKYWDDEDQDRIEELLRKMCQISPQRWNFWIELYDKKRRDKKPGLRSLPFLRKLHKGAKMDAPLRHSAELTGLFKQAEEIAPFRDTSEGRTVPILTSECVLLCIVRNQKSEISRKLAASGINVPQLERDALSSRRSRRE